MRTHPLQITKIISHTRIITPKIVVVSTRRTAAIHPVVKIHYLIVK